MGEEMPWRGPLPFLEVTGWRGFHPRQPLGVRLQDFSCLPILLAWGTYQECSAGQVPPRLASAPSSPNETHEEAQAQALHFHIQPPEYRSTNPEGVWGRERGRTQKHTPQCPHFQFKDHHAAPCLQSPWGVSQVGTRIVFVHIPQECWLITQHHPTCKVGLSFLSIRPRAL